LVDCKSFTSKLNCDDIASRLENIDMQGDSEFPESELLIRQLIYADKIILNKIDLVTNKELIDDIKRVIATVNP
jgi:G3E family GTPase